jgi:Fe-S-cluster-containing hydrogenase component 2
MKKRVVLCNQCSTLDLEYISSKIDGEVIISDRCTQDGDYAVLTCKKSILDGFPGNEFEIVDLELVEGLFSEPEVVAASWINSSLEMVDFDTLLVNTGYEILYCGNHVDIIEELKYASTLTAVISEPELIEKLYPFDVRLILGEVKEVQGEPGKYNVVVEGKDLVSDDDGAFNIAVGQVIMPGSGGTGFIYTYSSPEEEYRAALKALNNLGGFRKIKFFDYDESVCGHSKIGISGCQICTDCPSGSIKSANGKIQIDYSNCIACGFCASNCPTGAIKSNVVDNIIPKIDAATKNFESKYPVAFICDRVMGKLYTLSKKGVKLPPLLPVTVPCLNALSESHILYSVLKGHPVVVIGCDCKHAMYEDVFRVVESVLNAYGVNIHHFNPDNISELQKVEFTEIEKLIDGFKRSSLRRDFIELLKFLPQRKELKIKSKKYGFIYISESCTFCDACISFCPIEAIRKDMDSLIFYHGICFSCKLCFRICPEDAIQIDDLLDLSAIGEIEVYRAEMIFCPSCGEAHISKRAYEKIREGAGLSAALRFCPNCRPRMILESAYKEMFEDDEGD